MCGRYSETIDPLGLTDVISIASINCTFTPRKTISPKQNAPIVVCDNAQIELRELRWGLIPNWADDEKIGQKLFNARSETASEKPAFREAWQKRRCLVPATGFYEWNHRDGRNQPFHFTRPDRGLFCFAGLWERWRRPPAKQTEMFSEEFESPPPILDTFTILTREPNDLMAQYHDRMPVILNPESAQDWLNKTEGSLNHLMDELEVEAADFS